MRRLPGLPGALSSRVGRSSMVVALVLALGWSGPWSPHPAWGSGAAAGDRAALAPVLDGRGQSGLDYTTLLAARDTLYLLERSAGEVRAFPLHGMARAQQFYKALRRAEGNRGLIIGQPLSLSLVGATLYVLDDRATLWAYDTAAYDKQLVPLRAESRQGALRAATFPDGLGALVVLDTDSHGHTRLWGYRRGARGYISSPTLLPGGPGAPRGAATLIGEGGGGSLLLWVGGAAWAVWPQSRRPAARIAANGRAAVVGPLWRERAITAGALVLDPARATITLVQLGGARVAVVGEIGYTAPDGVEWHGLCGDATTGKIYLLSKDNRVYALPMPRAWRKV